MSWGNCKRSLTCRTAIILSLLKSDALHTLYLNLTTIQTKNSLLKIMDGHLHALTEAGKSFDYHQTNLFMIELLKESNQESLVIEFAQEPSVVIINRCRHLYYVLQFWKVVSEQEMRAKIEQWIDKGIVLALTSTS